MNGLRFERRGEDGYYTVIFHVGSTYVPVRDEDVEELKKQSASPGDQFLECFLDRMGYSSYLKDRIREELLKIGDRPRQIAALRESILAL